MECFITAFSQFSIGNVKICFLGAWLGTHHEIQVFQEEFLKEIPNSATRVITLTFTFW